MLIYVKYTYMYTHLQIHLYLFIYLKPYIFFIFIFGSAAACGTLVPWLGIEPVPPAVEVRSLNHWTAREVPQTHLSKKGASIMFCI